MREWGPGLLVVAGALALPWVWWTGLAVTTPQQAVIQTPEWFAMMGILLVGAAYVFSEDRWLGALVGWLVLRGLPASYAGTFQMAYVAVGGALMIVAVRRLPQTMRRPLVIALLIAGGIQVGCAALQAMGYDVPPKGFPRVPLSFEGSLGNTNYLGTYLAMLTPLAPVWAVAVFVGGIALSHAITGMVAAGAGLLVQYARRWWAWSVVGAGMGLAVVWHLSSVWETVHVRWIAVMVGWADMTGPAVLYGRGLGGWGALHPVVGYGLAIQAHNDYFQLFYEAGAISLVLLGGWLWAQRHIFTGPYRGAMVAIALTALTSFPFHSPSTGILAVALMGLALPPLSSEGVIA